VEQVRFKSGMDNKETSTDKKSLEIVLDSVMPRYMSTLDGSPCLSFNKGTIMPKQKLAGTKECTIMALNGEHKWTKSWLPPYLLCSLHMPSQPAALLFFNSCTQSYRRLIPTSGTNSSYHPTFVYKNHQHA